MRFFFVIFISIWWPTVDAAEDELLLYYYKRPPYLYRDKDGHVQGLVASPTTEALNRAGIAFRWVNLSTNRQLQRLRNASEKACAVGWYLLPEREEFAQFSLPIYHDSARVFLTRKNVTLTSPIDFSTALKQKELRLLLKDGFSYGTYVDARLRQAAIQIQRTTNEHEEMLQSMLVGRADLMLLSVEEARWMIEHVIDGDKRLRVVEFSDAIENPERHLMCSRRVSVHWMNAINQALQAAAAH